MSMCQCVYVNEYFLHTWTDINELQQQSCSRNDKIHFSTLEPSKKLNLKKTQDYTIFFLFIVTILVWLCS